jgi:hypothetical protein
LDDGGVRASGAERGRGGTAAGGLVLWWASIRLNRKKCCSVVINGPIDGNVGRAYDGLFFSASWICDPLEMKRENPSTPNEKKGGKDDMKKREREPSI